MKKVFTYSVLTFVLLSFTTCKKLFYKTTLTGYVIADNKDQPISNMKVYLLGFESKQDVNEPIQLDESNVTYTDNDGKFTFSFNRNDHKYFYVYPSPDNSANYNLLGDNHDLKAVETDKHLKKEALDMGVIYMSPLSVLKLKIVNKDLSCAYYNFLFDNSPTLQNKFTLNQNDSCIKYFKVCSRFTSFILGNKLSTASTYANYTNQTFIANFKQFDTTFYQVNF